MTSTGPSLLRALLVAASERLGPLTLTLLLLVCGFTHSAQDYWSTGDDHLNFFMTGLAIGNKESEDRLLGRATDTFAELGFREEGIESVAVRQKNLLNYLLPSAVYFAAAKLDLSLSPSGLAGGYDVHVTVSNLLGYLASFAIAAAMFVFALTRCPPMLQSQTALALTVILLVAVLLPESGYFRLREGLLERLLLGLLNPGTAYGPLGITPRNHYVLVALAIFLLRLSGHYRLAYAYLALDCLFHRQQGALLLVLLLLVDLIMRPRLLADLKTVIWPALGLSYFAAMETLWLEMGVSRLTGLAVVVIFAAAVFGAIALLARAQSAHRPQGGLLGLDRLFRDDRVLLLCAWVALTAISLTALAVGLRGAYFWELLPARLLIILQPLLVLSLVQLLTHRALVTRVLQPRSQDVVVPLGKALLVAGLIAVTAHSASTLAEAAAESIDELHAVERRLPLGISATLHYEDERHLYYAVNRSVETGSPHFDILIEATRRPRFDDLVKAMALSDRDLFVQALEDSAGLDHPTSILTPVGWPRQVIEAPPYVGAVIWNRPDMAEAIRARLGDRLPQVELATVCEAIAYGHNGVLHRLSLLSPLAALDRACPATPGLERAPPVCLLRQRREREAVERLVGLGVSREPTGGCPG